MWHTGPPDDDEEMAGGSSFSRGGVGSSTGPSSGMTAQHVSFLSDYDDEEREMMRKRQDLPGWRVDRGAGLHQVCGACCMLYGLAARWRGECSTCMECMQV